MVVNFVNNYFPNYFPKYPRFAAKIEPKVSQSPWRLSFQRLLLEARRTASDGSAQFLTPLVRQKGRKLPCRASGRETFCIANNKKTAGIFHPAVICFRPPAVRAGGFPGQLLRK
jgi:hypothetical protein